MTSTALTRLGSANTYDGAISNLSARQSALSNLQANLTSGKRVVRASDDPIGAAQAERAMTRISRIATDQRALASQRNSIAMAESTLGDVSDALQNFRELVVSAGSGIQTATDRQTIALQLTQLRDQIFGLANRQDTNGQPLFSALGSSLTPFVAPQTLPQDYTFDGLPGQTASSEVAIPFALDGESAFMGGYTISTSNASLAVKVALTTPPTPDSSYQISNISVVQITPPGPGPGTSTATYDLQVTTTAAPPVTTTQFGLQSTGYPTGTLPITIPGRTVTITGYPAPTDTISITPNPSIFNVMDHAIRDIGGASSSAAATQAVSQALGNIDIGMGRISAARGLAGALLNRADSISSNQDARSIQLEADRSRAEDIDMVKGISDFQNAQTGYQTALQSYAQVQKLSLFNYIG